VGSKRGGKSVPRIAADANVIPSAVIGKAALKIFTRSNVRVVTTDNVLEEVREYLPLLGENYGIAPEILQAQYRLLPIGTVPENQYKKFIPKAIRRIGKRDPDDVHLLALALSLRIPIWTNDRDFETTGVDCYTTARLLKQLGI
jgi:predicted nucleic acid-binding protein